MNFLVLLLLSGFSCAADHAAPSIPATVLRAAPIFQSVPTTPGGLVHLVIEPAVDKDSRGAYFNSEQSAAMKAVVEEAGATVRKLEGDGFAEIFTTHAYLEVNPQAASEVAEKLRAAGLRVGTIGEALKRFNQAQAGASDEAGLKAAAEALSSGTVGDRSEKLGSLVRAIETSADLSSLPEVTRAEAAREIYSGLAPIANAFQKLQGDQRIAGRRKFIDAQNGGAYEYVDMERAAHAASQEPAVKAQLAPLRDLVARAAQAIEKLDAKVSTPLLLALLPHADYAYHESLKNDGARVAKLIRGWLSLLKGSVEDTERLVGQKGARTSMSSGGVGNQHVLGHWASVWTSDPDAWLYPMDQLAHGSAWKLVASLFDGEITKESSIRQILSDGFVQVLLHAEPLIAKIDAKEKARKAAEASAQLDRMAGEFLKDPTLKEQMEQLRANHMRDFERRYAEHDRIRGQTVLDSALISLGAFGYYGEMTPGFKDNEYVLQAVYTLREATKKVVGSDMFALVADTALELIRTIRAVKPKLEPLVEAQVSELDAAVRERAVREKLILRKSDD